MKIWNKNYFPSIAAGFCVGLFWVFGPTFIEPVGQFTEYLAKIFPYTDRNIFGFFVPIFILSTPFFVFFQSYLFFKFKIDKKKINALYSFLLFYLGITMVLLLWIGGVILAFSHFTTL